MSEEEIIKNINEMIELINHECYISISEDIESIKALLSLYIILKTKYEKQKKINLEQNQYIDNLKTEIRELQEENEELEELNEEFKEELEDYWDNDDE